MRAAEADSEFEGAKTGGWICPSAQPDEDAVVLGVVGTGRGRARSLLPRQLPLEAVAHLLPDSASPTDMLRLGAPCAGSACGHFAGGRCTLAARIVARLDAMTDAGSSCALRESCVWRRQEGAAVCRRCPQISDEPARVSDVLARAARPVLVWSRVA
jgi:hypothetical protein